MCNFPQRATTKKKKEESMCNSGNWWEGNVSGVKAAGGRNEGAELHRFHQREEAKPARFIFKCIRSRDSSPPWWMVAFSTFMIKRFPFLWKSNSFSSRGQRNALRCPFYRRLVTHIQRRAPFVCAQGQTKNIIYVRYTGIFFSFLAQLLSVLLQSIFHILSENCVIFSEYLN